MSRSIKMMMLGWCIAALITLLLASLAHAQTRSATKVTSGTITATGTFQSVLGGNGARTGCMIQNNGTHTMNLYAGALANATATNSLVLAAGATFTCSPGNNTVLTDPIAITGTLADPFVAFEQSAP